MAITMVHERTDQLKEQAEVMMQTVPCAASLASGDNSLYRTMRPFLRLGMKRLDEIGETARATPLLIIVLVLDASTFVNDWSFPNLHVLYHAYEAVFPAPPIPELWAERVAMPPSSATFVSAGDCHGKVGFGEERALAACAALGPLNASASCAAPRGWLPKVTAAPWTALAGSTFGGGGGSAAGLNPTSAAAAREGARFWFAHPLRANYLDVHYQLASRWAVPAPAGDGSGRRDSQGDWRALQRGPAQFVLRIELMGTSSLESAAELKEEETFHVHDVAEAEERVPTGDTPRVYHVHVSSSLLDNSDRNVTVVPMSAGAPTIIVGRDKQPAPSNRLLSAIPILGPLLSPLPPPPRDAVESGENVACPRPLRLRLLAHNGTVPIQRVLTSSIVVSVVHASAAAAAEQERTDAGGGGMGPVEPDDGLDVRIDGLMLEGAHGDDTPVEEEIEVEIMEEEEVEGVTAEFELPIAEIISALAALSMAAASSEFVRKHVKVREPPPHPQPPSQSKSLTGEQQAPSEDRPSLRPLCYYPRIPRLRASPPSCLLLPRAILCLFAFAQPEEYAKQKAKEGEKKAAQLEKNAADAAVRALIATPCDEVDIEGAKLTIDEAHEANVMRSLIEKAFEHVQQAVDVQLMEPHNQSPAAELL